MSIVVPKLRFNPNVKKAARRHQQVLETRNSRVLEADIES